MNSNRFSDYSIHQQFLDRWSPRAFTGEAMEENTLFTLLEAAHWAPSSYNAQPWRFIYALKDSPNWPDMMGLLSEFNHAWANRASAMVILLSKKTFVPPGKTEAVANASHTFDSGAAWAYLALQASLSGWAAHGIGGFDKDRAREVLGIPDDYQVEVAIAIGRPAKPDCLPSTLQEMEKPGMRRPLRELVAANRFDFRD